MALGVWLHLSERHEHELLEHEHAHIAQSLGSDADHDRYVRLGHAAPGHGFDHLALRLARLEGGPAAYSVDSNRQPSVFNANLWAIFCRTSLHALDVAAGEAS